MTSWDRRSAGGKRRTDAPSSGCRLLPSRLRGVQCHNRASQQSQGPTANAGAPCTAQSESWLNNDEQRGHGTPGPQWQASHRPLTPSHGRFRCPSHTHPSLSQKAQRASFGTAVAMTVAAVQTKRLRLESFISPSGWRIAAGRAIKPAGEADGAGRAAPCILD